jgi:hypothetical protein
MIHTCNVCGKKDKWNDEWTWRFIMHKDKKYPEAGYEEIYKMCSVKCLAIADKKVKWIVNV